MEKREFYKLCGVFGRAMCTRIRQMPRDGLVNQKWVDFVQQSADLLVTWSETHQRGKPGRESRREFITRLTAVMEVGCVWTTFHEHVQALKECYQEECSVRIAEATTALLLETLDDTTLAHESLGVLPMGVWIPLVLRRLDLFRGVLLKYASTFHPDIVQCVYESMHRDPLFREVREDTTNQRFLRIHHGAPVVFPYLHVSGGRE